MTRALLAHLVCLSLLACGPGPSPDFAGQWVGATSVWQEEAWGVTTTSLHLAVDGWALSFSGPCPDGSGTVRMWGSEEEASWEGSLACQPVAFGACDAVRVTLTSATAQLQPDGWMRTEAKGTTDGCGASASVVVRFAGRPPR